MRAPLLLLFGLAACAEPAPHALATPRAPAVVTDADDTDDSDTDSDTADDGYYPTGGTTSCDQGGAGLASWAAGLLLLALARRRRAAVGLTALGVGGVAQAQDPTPTLDVQRFEPPGMISGFAATYTARQLPRGRVSFEAMGDYAWRPYQSSRLVSGNFVRAEGAVENLTAVHMRLSAAPTDWLQLSIGAPVVQFVGTGPGLPTLGGPGSTTVGYGDVQGEISLRAMSEERGVGLSLTTFVAGPTGTRDLLLTDGVPTFGLRAALSATPRPVHVGVHVGYRVKPGSSQLGGKFVLDDSLMYGLGLGFLLFDDIARLNIEGFGETTVGPGYKRITQEPVTGRLHTAFELNANLRIATRIGFDFLLGGGAGLTPAPGSPAARVTFGFGYVPELPPDFDHDGISNWDDECRKDPEDFDNFEDADGCPDYDNDEDGIPDEDDACPDDHEDVDGWEDDDGCPDRDNDRDRIADNIDSCPDVPEDLDRYQDKDGCPDADNDGDGIPDPRDNCPNVAEDKDGFSDDDGCPEEERDRDADGVIDNFDPCEDDPEDFDNYQDDDGCPEADNDEDRILDPDDLCPNDPEVYNGNTDDDGCPDDTMAVLHGDRIVILEKVHFYVNDAKIRPESYPVLDAVAATLVAHPEVPRIRVEGHTDSDGSDAHNQELSEKRAASVRLYLVERGIDVLRLESVGYGEIYPIATNKTPEGREMNRRVEFMVVPVEPSLDDPPAVPSDLPPVP